MSNSFRRLVLYGRYMLTYHQPAADHSHLCDRFGFWRVGALIPIGQGVPGQ
jgi:hypothetical protein